MKYVCTFCERISPDGNLWCIEQTCLAELKPLVLDTGDDIGDLEIVRRLSVSRTAAIYEAKRDDQRLLVKVAHSSPEAQAKLKYEADVLRTLLSKRQHYALPTLVAPYRNAPVHERPYGKVGFQNETKYYMVFEYVHGTFLSDTLRSTPQPWYQHAAWIVMQIADAVAFMHENNKLHLNISPSGVLIRYDKDNIPRPVLMDFGYPAEMSRDYAEGYSGVSYAAPELLRKQSPTKTTDVYGLGSLFYEMLAGRPAYPSRSRGLSLVRSEVMEGSAPPIKRSDLPVPPQGKGYRETPIFVGNALAARPEMRQQDVATFAHEVRRLYGDAPAERRGRKFTRRTLIGIVAAIVLALVLVQLLFALLG
jgi:serine/threonine protein kinase